MARRYEGLSFHTTPEKQKPIREVGAERLQGIKDFGSTMKERMGQMFGKTKEFGMGLLSGAKNYGKTAVEYGLAAPEAVGQGLSKLEDKLLIGGLDKTAAMLDTGIEATKSGVKAGARAVGHGAVEAGKFGVGVALAGAEAVGEGAKFVAKKGQEGYQYVSETTRNLYEAGSQKVNDATEWGIAQKNAAVDRYHQTMETIKGKYESWKQSREQRRQAEERARLMAERAALSQRLQEIEKRLGSNIPQEQAA